MIVGTVFNSLGCAIAASQDGGLDLKSFSALARSMWKSRERQKAKEELELDMLDFDTEKEG
jgi:hypothetical protein